MSDSDDDKADKDVAVPVVVRNREGPNPYGFTASTLGGYSTFMIKQYYVLELGAHVVAYF